MSHFSERSYRRDLGQIGILGGNWHCRWGWCFFRWDLKTPCIKNSEYKSQPKTKKIPIVISAISHFRSPFIIITPSYPQIIFLWRAKFFLSVAPRAWEYFKFLGGLLYWGVLISFFGGGGTIFSQKAINDQSCKLKNSWWQNYLLHVCMLTFHTSTLEFSLGEFSLFKCPLKLQKKSLVLLGIYSVKVWILFHMSSK